MKTKEELRKEIETLREQNKNLQNILSWKNTYIENLERDSKFWGSAKIEIFRDGKLSNTVNIDKAIYGENNIIEVLTVAEKLYSIDETNAEQEISYKITIKEGGFV